jgi:hypothetical protein
LTPQQQLTTDLDLSLDDLRSKIAHEEAAISYFETLQRDADQMIRDLALDHLNKQSEMEILETSISYHLAQEHAELDRQLAAQEKQVDLFRRERDRFLDRYR